MDLITSTPATAPATATATAPAITPTPSPAPIPMVSQPNVQMAEGGNIVSETSSGVKGFFNDLNWMEVGFSILGVSALVYVIYYYRFKLQQDKLINNELQRQIDEIKMNLQSNLKGKYKNI